MKFATICLVLFAGTAQAQLTCPPGEYAMYKDKAKSGSGRIQLAFEYCRLSGRGERLMGPAADQCHAEARKILEALGQSDPKGAQFAVGGCNGKYMPR
jgi:hypothetical protein